MMTTCKHCLTLFEPRRAGAIFCSGACRTAACHKRALVLRPTRWIGRRAAGLRHQAARASPAQGQAPAPPLPA